MGRHTLLRHLRHQFQIDWWGHHGIAHWSRVRANGLVLANLTGANRHVGELFVFFLDSCRFNQHMDDGHGARGAALASRLKDLYFDANDEEMVLLLFAYVHHTDGMTKGDATVMSCWDADRLDLSRVGITPKAKYLGTNPARADTVMAKTNRRAQAWRDV